MCESGLGPEAELHWEEDKKASLSRCANLKHVFARTARDCPDVTFLTLEVQSWAIFCPSISCHKFAPQAWLLKSWVALFWGVQDKSNCNGAGLPVGEICVSAGGQ